MQALITTLLLLLSLTSHAGTWVSSTDIVKASDDSVRYTATLDDKPSVKRAIEVKKKMEAINAAKRLEEVKSKKRLETLNTAKRLEKIKVMKRLNAEQATQETIKKAAAVEKRIFNTWSIQQDETLRSGLNKWVTKAGWRYLAWQSEREFPIVVGISVSGSFQEAISQVLKAYHRSGNPLYGCLKGGNKVLVIADKPLNDKCYSNNATSEGK